MSRLFLAYVVTGGMPEVVQRYVDTHDVAQVVRLQRDIVALYRQDIVKYAPRKDTAKIRDIFDAIPSQLADKNRRFILADLSRGARQNRYVDSFLWLADAGVSLPCHVVDEPVVPLEASSRRGLFKLFMNDVGLLCSRLLENVQLDILRGDLTVNMGSVAENVVAQQLAANGFRLRYFNGRRRGEVDFVLQSGSKVIPVEVKSGADWRRHRALDNVMATGAWGLDEAYVLCPGNVEVDGLVTYLPLYMTMFLRPQSLPESMPFEVDLSGL